MVLQDGVSVMAADMCLLICATVQNQERGGKGKRVAGCPVWVPAWHVRICMNSGPLVGGAHKSIRDKQKLNSGDLFSHPLCATQALLCTSKCLLFHVSNIFIHLSFLLGGNRPRCQGNSRSCRDYPHPPPRPGLHPAIH